MTVRKIIELVDFIKTIIGAEQYSSVLQDQIVTIQNNPNNLVLLKEITDKTITDFEKLKEKEIPELLDKVLVEQVKPFTQDTFYQQLLDLKEANYPDPGSQYNTLNTILTQIQARVNQNIAELDKIKATVEPFLTRDFSELQKEDNALFAIIFNNVNSYNNLKTLSFELIFKFFKSHKVNFDLSLQVTNRYCCRCGIHCLSCPEPLPNNNLKVQDKNYKPNRIPSAETAADSELQPKITTSRRTCSNTHVACSFISRVDNNRHKYAIHGLLFFVQLASL